MRIEVLLTEDRLAEELLKAFASRRVPEKFFYWSPLSVRAWLNLCRTGEYKNFMRSHDLLLKRAADIASLLPRGDLDVVSLGSGQGIKDLSLLEALRARGCKARYFPVDASQALLEMACDAAISANFPCYGFKADITDAEHLAALRAGADKPRLYLLLGNTLGAFDPLPLCRELAKLMRPEDKLLIDGELFAGHETIAGYDNTVNRQFAFAPLKSVGISEQDGQLVFELCEDERIQGLCFLAKHFKAWCDLKLLIAGEVLQIKAGERIDMNFSYKYSRQAFLNLLRDVGGFDIVAEYLSDDGLFLTALARIGSEPPDLGR